MPIETISVEDLNEDSPGLDFGWKCEKCGHEWPDYEDPIIKCPECSHIQPIDIELSEADIARLGWGEGRLWECALCQGLTLTLAEDKCAQCAGPKMKTGYECPRCGCWGKYIIECTNYHESGIPWDAHGHSWTEHVKCARCGQEYDYSNADY